MPGKRLYNLFKKSEEYRKSYYSYCIFLRTFKICLFCEYNKHLFLCPNCNIVSFCRQCIDNLLDHNTSDVASQDPATLFKDHKKRESSPRTTLGGILKRRFKPIIPSRRK